MSLQQASNLAPSRRWRRSAGAAHSVSAGVELFCLCHTASADGTLSQETCARVRECLSRTREQELPARAYVEQLIGQILASARVVPADLSALGRALEPVLPETLRRRRPLHLLAGGALERGEEPSVAPIKNEVLASASFPVTEGHADLARAARGGVPVLLARERDSSRSPHCVRVSTREGKLLGYVPEQRARTLAPLLDRGARHRAHIVSAERGAHGPIVIVQAFLYRSDAALGLVGQERRIQPRIASTRVWSVVRLLVALGIATAVALVLRS